MGPSPFRALDRFVDSKLAIRKGFHGAIRAWSIDSMDNLSHSVITYQIKGNRWCENIQRCHKSNNIMWHVSIGDSKYWQTCHDPECRMMHFRGRINELPKDVKDDTFRVLFDKDTEISESFERALLDFKTPNKKTGDRPEPDKEGGEESLERVSESFERALLDFKTPNNNTGNSPEPDYEGNQSFERGSESFEQALLEFQTPKKQMDNRPEQDHEVDESFERALMNLNLSKTFEEGAPEDVIVDEAFEKALMGLKIGGEKEETSADCTKDGEESDSTCTR